MDKIAVSIIIPIYNAERHLAECLDSCLKQTLEQIEIICVNDGSTDNTKKILEKYAGEYSNITIMNQNNQGSGAARNLGIEHARGEFIAFMDSDDYYPDKNSLKKLYNEAIKWKVLVCGGSAIHIVDGKVNRDNTELCFEENRIMHYKEYQVAFGYIRFIYNTEFLRDSGINFPQYRRYQDPPFFAKVMIAVDKFYVISDCVYLIRNTDKIVKYSNKDIVIGGLMGILDILKISKENQFAVLHASEVVHFKDQFLSFVYKLIYQGNDDVKEYYEKVLAEIDETLLNKDKRRIKKPKLMTDEEIHQMIINSLKRERELLDEINSYKTVLIYGAGRAGRLFYDYIKQIGCNIDMEFMVSAETPDYTACGKQVHSIQEYVNIKDSALVVIANKNNALQMEENARNYQFQHIELISYDELMLFGADMIDGNKSGEEDNDGQF